MLEQWDAARVHEIGALNLTCTDGGTMTAIDFASYGWYVSCFFHCFSLPSSPVSARALLSPSGLVCVCRF